MSDEAKTADDAPVEGAVDELQEDVPAEPVVIPEYHFVVFLTGIAHTGSHSDRQCFGVWPENVYHISAYYHIYPLTSLFAPITQV